jgi:hypothetical protein
VHGEIGRRDFLDGAQKFAIGGVTAAALFQMLKPNYAWAVQVPADDKRIKAEYDTVPSPQGNGSVRGYLARPANATKLPTVLVIHENRGLNPYIEADIRRMDGGSSPNCHRFWLLASLDRPPDRRRVVAARCRGAPKPNRMLRAQNRLQSRRMSPFVFDDTRDAERLTLST